MALFRRSKGRHAAGSPSLVAGAAVAAPAEPWLSAPLPYAAALPSPGPGDGPAPGDGTLLGDIAALIASGEAWSPAPGAVAASVQRPGSGATVPPMQVPALHLVALDQQLLRDELEPPGPGTWPPGTPSVNLLPGMATPVPTASPPVEAAVPPATPVPPASPLLEAAVPPATPVPTASPPVEAAVPPVPPASPLLQAAVLPLAAGEGAPGPSARDRLAATLAAGGLVHPVGAGAPTAPAPVHPPAPVPPTPVVDTVSESEALDTRAVHGADGRELTLPGPADASPAPVAPPASSTALHAPRTAAAPVPEPSPAIPTPSPPAPSPAAPAQTRALLVPPAAPAPGSVPAGAVSGHAGPSSVLGLPTSAPTFLDGLLSETAAPVPPTGPPREAEAVRSLPLGPESLGAPAAEAPTVLPSVPQHGPLPVPSPPSGATSRTASPEPLVPPAPLSAARDESLAGQRPDPHSTVPHRPVPQRQEPTALELAAMQLSGPVERAAAPARVQLGFRDGSTAALDPDSDQAAALEELAQLLNLRD